MVESTWAECGKKKEGPRLALRRSHAWWPGGEGWTCRRGRRSDQGGMEKNRGERVGTWDSDLQKQEVPSLWPEKDRPSSPSTPKAFPSVYLSIVHPLNSGSFWVQHKCPWFLIDTGPRI